MKMTPLQRRAQRRNRNQTMVDMNLVSLIDVFTILIFFLLSNATGVELLPSPKAVTLPESVADKSPRETPVVVVNGQEITFGGRKLASVDEVLAAPGDVIAPLLAELQSIAGQQPAPQPVADAASGAVAPKGRAITLMGDKDIPYRLLRKIMVTCARADFSDVSFAVRQRSGS